MKCTMAGMDVAVVGGVEAIKVKDVDGAEDHIVAIVEAKEEVIVVAEEDTVAIVRVARVVDVVVEDVVVAVEDGVGETHRKVPLIKPVGARNGKLMTRMMKQDRPEERRAR